MSASVPTIAVCIVTHDAAADIRRCLDAVAASDHPKLEIVVVDCASQDQTVTLLRSRPPIQLPLRIDPLTENLGFAGGMNRALQLTAAEWVLSLNADAQPTPSYISRLLGCASIRPQMRVGAVTGRLVRPEPSSGAPILDACGMELRASWRHLDRGSGAVDRRQWMNSERVFGATGAASLFRRAALDDVAVDGEVFAGEFHSFREDAELCFRLRERGWEVLYEPTALCYHRRRNLPERRRGMPAEVNLHSLKNRYLLRAYHQDALNTVLTLIPAVWRDLLALAYVVTLERTSLPAYSWLWQNRARILRRRRQLRSRRTVSSWELNRWFFSRGRPL